MPTLPTVKVSQLKHTAKGSLVKLEDFKGNRIFGLHVAILGERGDKPASAFVALRPRAEGGIAADLIPSHNPNGWKVDGSYPVVDYSTGWSLQVRAADWDARPKLRTFDPQQAGWLLLDEDGMFGLAVRDDYFGYLRLNDWVLERPNTRNHIATSRWNISLPWLGDAFDWPLGYQEAQEAPMPKNPH